MNGTVEDIGYGYYFKPPRLSEKEFERRWEKRKEELLDIKRRWEIQEREWKKHGVK
ncbi:hypothetical protein [Halalkalibacterium halodurans]|uniref:hypothetical protein n=1 Tax=Halalkalibacterium halodurans TaxID=86665 RepID=UPI0014196A1D|nr:hypothetical protein [Halalkalibacterium halodurans]